MNIEQIENLLYKYKNNPKIFIKYGAISVGILVLWTFLSSIITDIAGRVIDSDSSHLSHDLKSPDLITDYVTIGKNIKKKYITFVVPIRNVTDKSVTLKSINMYLDGEFNNSKLFGKPMPCAVHEGAGFTIGNTLTSVVSSNDNKILDFEGEFRVDENLDEIYPAQMIVTIEGCGVPYSSELLFKIEFPVNFAPSQAKVIYLRIPENLIIKDVIGGRNVEGVFEYIDKRDIPKIVRINEKRGFKIVISANGKANIILSSGKDNEILSRYYDSKTGVTRDIEPGSI